MPLYRFYRIVSDKGTEEYIGSTQQPLYKRFHQHLSSYKQGKLKCSSKTLFDLYGVDSCSIVLISEMECETKQYALREERRIYDERRESIVNQKRPYVSEKEVKDYFKAYRQSEYKANKEAIKANRKAHYETNKEAIYARQKAYNEANKDAINANRRANYEIQKTR